MTSNRPFLTALSGLAAVAVLATSCTSSSTETSDASTSAATSTPTSLSTTAPAASDSAAPADGSETEGDGSSGEAAVVDESLTIMVSNLADKYRAVEGAWPGFDPTEHPALVAVQSADETTALVAINHPDPDALGDATPIDGDDLPFTAHSITNLTAPEELDSVAPFDFNSIQGGVDSFVIVADPSDSFFAPDSAEFAATYIHELFHRYQIATFNETLTQDFEGYAYTAENLQLAVLEDRALSEALTAESDEDRDTAARRFAGLRLARRAASPEVGALDDSQEIGEGTARYIEHLTATADSGSAYHVDNFEADLLTGFDQPFGVKETFAFGRFYASGAAIVELLHRIGADDITGRIEANEPPATILADTLGVTEAQVEELVADAKSNYDPLDELAAEAIEAAKQAAGEPPVFDDIPGGAEGEDGAEGDGGDGILLTDEELACLEEQGVDFDDEATLSDEALEVCLP